MRKSIAILALVAFVALGLMYTGVMTAHAAVHISKTVKTQHGIIHKSAHAKHGTVVHTGNAVPIRRMAY